MDDRTPAQERAARRRWLTIGEVAGVLAVFVSAAALWDSHQERVQSDAARAAGEHKAASVAAVLVLRGTPSDSGAVLRLTALDSDQVIQDQELRFPAALGLAPVHTTGDPRIEAGWFADALKKARHAAGQDDTAEGDEQLPVAIATSYIADGVRHRDRAIYDLGYTLRSRFLGGRAVTVRGLSLVGKGDAASLDARWRAGHPAAKKA